jgi:hypothetical protein
MKILMPLLYLELLANRFWMFFFDSHPFLRRDVLAAVAIAELPRAVAELNEILALLSKADKR